MHTNTTRATQNATLPRRNRQNPALYQHILSDLAVEADQLKTPVSPTTPTKIRDKNNTKCPIAQPLSPRQRRKLLAKTKSRNRTVPGFIWVADGTRTRDVLDHNQVLYQLNYSHHRVAVKATDRA